MTLNEVYLKGKEILNEAGIDSPAFDAMCIFKLCFKLNRQDIILCRNNIAEPQKVSQFFDFIEERKLGRPLQYILGKWDFMGLEFKVGEGVLIPRDDTEVLVKEALNLIKDIKNPKILDLCSGSGAIAISLAKNRPDAKVAAVELSDAAFKYLKENIAFNNVENVVSINGDVLAGPIDFKEGEFDIIVSNPPYIPTKDIDTLQKEVKNEPIMALDGGNDGLLFYRAIAKKWYKLLKKKGFLCMEIGIDQSSEVINIYRTLENTKDIYTIKDFNGIDRVVVVKSN